MTDQYDRIVSVNQNFLKLYRIWSKNHIIGMAPSDLYQFIWRSQTTVDETWLALNVSKLLENLRFTGAPFEMPIPSNRWIRMITQRDRNGMLFSVHTDITELKRKQEALEVAEQKARQSEQQYKLLAQHASDVIVGLDQELRVLYASPSIYQLLGLRPETILHQSWSSAIASDEGMRFHGIHTLRMNEKEFYTFRAYHIEGHVVWIEKSVSVLPAQHDASGIEFIFHLRDVTSRKLIEEKLEKANDELTIQARTDALTLLANRRHFNDVVKQEWRRMRREKEKLALLLIDIDHFKSINDQFGHPAGDRCLKVVARHIQQFARRPGDLAARYGGEEFALLLPQTNSEEAVTIAEIIRQAVSQSAVPHQSGQAIRLTVSIGIVSFVPTTEIDNAEVLVREADVALYRAKRNGRNRCELAV